MIQHASLGNNRVASGPQAPQPGVSVMRFLRCPISVQAHKFRFRSSFFYTKSTVSVSTNWVVMAETNAAGKRTTRYVWGRFRPCTLVTGAVHGERRG